MVTAIVLMKAARGSVSSAARALLDISGVNEVYSVAGA